MPEKQNQDIEHINSTKTTISIGDLNNGIYLMNAYNDSNSSINRFVKEYISQLKNQGSSKIPNYYVIQPF